MRMGRNLTFPKLTTTSCRTFFVVWLSCVIGLSAIPSFASQELQVRVVTEHFPPFQVLGPDKTITGISVETMRQVMEASGFDYQLEVMPWARAYSTALDEKNVIIFSMVRNPDREDKFVWLGELQRADYHLFGLTNHFKKPFTSIDEARNFIAVASRQSYEAKELVRLGFVEGKNLILTVDFDDYWPMITRRRANMTLTLKKLAEQRPNTISLWPVAENISLWAAASKGTDESIVERLRFLLNDVHITDTETIK